MKRRKFVSGIGVGVMIGSAGCTNDSRSAGEDSTETQTDEGTSQTTEEESENQADAVLSYEVTEGSDWDEDLPDLISDYMNWVVLSFEVEEGEVSMEDLWFRSRIDTGERYQPADAQTNNALENGIENRGSILEDGSADVLYKVPTFAEEYAWNLSGLRRQTVTGENIQVDEPGEFYGDVTVSVDIEITQDSDIITPEAEEFRDEGQYWGIVTIEVIEVS